MLNVDVVVVVHVSEHRVKVCSCVVDEQAVTASDVVVMIYEVDVCG